MSSAAFAFDSDTSTRSRSRGSTLRVNKPGDSFEVEADRVADTVARDGKIGNLSGFSLSRLNMGNPAGQVQRESTDTPGSAQVPAPAPKPNNYDEALGKIGEAFLKTDLGKQLTEQATRQPIVKDAEDFASTLPGKIIIGAAATGTLSALAATHTPLPAQIPSIPLDKIRPGLSVKITYEGPVDKPSKATISFTYTPKSAPEDKKNKLSATDKQRAENARNENDLYNFQESLKSPQQRQQEAADAQHALDAWVTRPNAMYGGLDPNKYIPGAPGKPAGPQLTLPPVQTPLDRKHPSLLDKKLELKPIAGLSDNLADVKKKEEVPVQRKAQPSPEIHADAAEVESVVHSPGHSLDAQTQRYMETRIGFDFSKVRVHTDTRAAASAQSLGAEAYTVGSSVVFGAGRYAPHTPQGKRLLAHELTHVVQQTSPVRRNHPAALPAPRPSPRQIQRFLGIEIPNVKDWLKGKIKEIKGYDLFCVIIGQDLISGQQVDRNADSLTHGVLEIFPDGPALFEKLKKAANAIDTAYHWILGQLKELELMPEDFSKLMERVVDAADLTSPFQSWDRIKAILAEPFSHCIELAKRVGKAVFDFILKAVIESFPLGKKVYDLIKKASGVVSQIAADPIKFAKNLFTAIQDGFSNFGKNILTHLGEGVKTWIFEELAIKGVTILTEFSFASILKLILQVLGLTYDQLRPRLVKKLSEPAVYFFETAAKVLTRIQKEGFSAVWEMIKEQANSIFDGLLGSIKSWIAKEIVERALLIVAKLASPVGEVIEAIQGIYEIISFILEKASKLVDLIDTVVNALSDIVNGVLGPAAQKVEDSLAKTIPLILRFLAGLLHLTGIGKSIREIIDKIREPIENVVDKVLDLIVDKAMPLWEKGKEAFSAKLDSIKDWWSKPAKFNYGDEEHELTVEGEGDKPEVYVHSDKSRLSTFLDDHKATKAQKTKALNLAKGLSWKDGKLESLSKKEAGYNNFVALRDLMDKLRSKNPMKSQVQDQNPVHSEFGSGVSSEAFLTPDLLTGSGPYKGPGPAAWEDLGYLLPPAEPHYVRGHLVSEKLGGRGDWTNMMPITNAANGEMERTVESALKDATADRKNRHYYHYKVEATYGNPRVPSLKNATTQAELDRRSDLAEKRLVKLSWRVKDAVYDSDESKFKITREKPLDQNGNAFPDKVLNGNINPRQR